MAELLDNCRFTAGSSGTADFADGTAVAGCRNLAAASAQNGVTYRYKAQNATLTQWERGYGAYNSGTGILARSTIVDSSDGGSKVSFSTNPEVILSPGPADFLLPGNNLSDVGSPASAFAAIKQAASESATGVVELATAAETATGTDNTRALHPAGAASVYSKIGRTINAQTGSSYTLALTDAGNVVTMDNGSANSLEVPPNDDVAFAVGAQIDGAQLGTGQTTITPGSGVTIVSDGSKTKVAVRYGGFTLLKLATNTWLLQGNLAT